MVNKLGCLSLSRVLSLVLYLRVSLEVTQMKHTSVLSHRTNVISSMLYQEILEWAYYGSQGETLQLICPEL